MVKLSTIHELALQAAPSTRARGIAVKLSPAAYLHCIALPPPDRNSPRAKLQKWPHAITVSPQICRRKLSTKKKKTVDACLRVQLCSRLRGKLII